MTEEADKAVVKLLENEKPAPGVYKYTLVLGEPEIVPATTRSRYPSLLKSPLANLASNVLEKLTSVLY